MHEEKNLGDLRNSVEIQPITESSLRLLGCHTRQRAESYRAVVNWVPRFVHEFQCNMHRVEKKGEGRGEFPATIDRILKFQKDEDKTFRCISHHAKSTKRQTKYVFCAAAKKS